MSNGWIGVDLDATLAEYHGFIEDVIGKPVPVMLERVKRWLAEGWEVRIVTARVGTAEPGRVSDTPEKIEAIRTMIEDWCEEHLGQRLRVTNEKDYGMVEIWDDRCVQVEENTGRIIGRSTRGL
jgi:hypothetical protein